MAFKYKFISQLIILAKSSSRITEKMWMNFCKIPGSRIGSLPGPVESTDLLGVVGPCKQNDVEPYHIR